MKRHTARSVDLINGPIIPGILRFALPIFLGQLLQQLYNLADAWVVGNFADNNAFAAVSSATNLTLLIIGFFNGIALGGGVVISRYFGAGDQENVEKAIHTNFLLGLIASVLSTVVGLLLVPHILVWMKVPESVLPDSLCYFNFYFAGVSTIIMFNICMAIMQALGDSLRPLYYLAIASITNVIMDLVLVAGFHLGVGGAAFATVLAQGLSAALCILRMLRGKDLAKLELRKLRLYPGILSQVLLQGLPAGIQGSVVSIGNLVIQTNINTFGAYAMSGHGAYSKIEGLAFLPIMSMSQSLPTFVSQNLGAGRYDRARKGGIAGILIGMALAEGIGVLLYFQIDHALSIFVDTPQAISYGSIHAHIVALFFFLLAFSHCAAGVLRGCGKSVVPMIAMLSSWCVIRIIYVTLTLRVFPVFQTISWAYPLTWLCSSIVLLVALLRLDWSHIFQPKQPHADF